MGKEGKHKSQHIGSLSLNLFGHSQGAYEI